MLRRHLYRLVLTSFALSALVSQAAITVDPLSTGATDVLAGDYFPGNLLVNPVTDPFSTVVLQVGNTSAGSLHINNGSVINSQATHVASLQGSTGELLVTGNTTRLISSYDFRVGLRGVGVASITNGALLESDQGWVGAGALWLEGDGSVNVSGVGSRWNNKSTFFTVGEDGAAKGRLNITSGGMVDLNTSHWDINVDDLYYDDITINGSVRVDGVGSTLKKYGAFAVRLGDLWQYGLEVTDGGLVDIDGDLVVGESNNPTSRVLLNNGSIDTHTLWFNPDKLTGTGVVNTTGLVMDGTLTFDATHGPQQQLLVQDLPGQNITINLDHSQGGSLGVGHHGQGLLTISEGRQLTTSQKGILGKYIGSAGTAVVTGAGTKWTAVEGLIVGDRGEGILRIEQGATVETNADVLIGRFIESTGSQIEFDGGTLNAGTLFTTGNDLLGTGTINTNGLVIDGEIVFDQSSGSEQQLVLDHLPGQNVTVNLSIDEGTLGVGYRGHGSVTVIDGQNVGADRVVLGYGTGGRGEGLITGAGSVLDARVIEIGNANSQAEGRLEIASGGEVQTGSINVQSYGQIVAQGAGSLLKTQTMGIYGGSSVEILAGAHGQGNVYLGESVFRVHGPGSKYVASTVMNQQGLISIEDQAVVEITSSLYLNEAMISIDGGTLDMKGKDISANQNGSHMVLGSGTLKNVRTLTGDLQQLGGELIVSSSPASKTTISGDYFMSGDSTLRLILNEEPTGSDEMMRVQNRVVLGGILDVEWGSGFTPTLGSTYSLFGNPQRIAGEFDNINLPEINADLRWALVDEVTNFQRRLFLTVVSTGDFDLDGDVDGRDLLLWQRNPSIGDLADWQNNYGSGATAGLSNSVAVPEPTSLALIATLGIVVLGRRNLAA
jgi:T5SS/PEP-CTERM-associated repeat protein